MKSAEQKARDLLERMEVDGAQNYSAGEISELADLIVAVHIEKSKNEKRYDEGYSDGESSRQADLNGLLETLDYTIGLPFDIDEMSEFEAVEKMAKLLNTGEQRAKAILGDWIKEKVKLQSRMPYLSYVPVFVEPSLLLKSDSGITRDGEGNKVWEDQSGNGNHAVLSAKASLDGHFTADQLEAIAWWMRNKL